MIDFDQYIRQGDNGKREKASAWRTAIGLQAVDGLTVSDYLQETAQRHIEGEITIDEVKRLIKTYYEAKSKRAPDDEEKNEADIVSSNITDILSTRTLDFSMHGLISLHRRIFTGVFSHAGKLRTYDISKKEWVLNGDSVTYLYWNDLHRAIDYDLEQERNFSYAGLTQDDLIAHITQFVSGLWQIHPFGEGNTRTTAVFTIQYLRSIGFEVDNDLFEKNSWYFRNALVRANYKNAQKGIDYSPVYLERFFRNLLLDDKWDLRNRYLHINATDEWQVQPNLNSSAQVTSDNHPTSTQQVPNKLQTYNPNIERLISIVGEQSLSVKEILSKMGLKDRVNLIKLYLEPAMNDGFLRLLYPNSPRHPKQRYLLTAKGLLYFTTKLK